MNESPYIAAPVLTKEEFRARVIDSINSTEFTPELLRTIFTSLPEDKRTLFDEYRVTDIIDPISSNKPEWERGAYFYKHLKMAELNFCLERIEHLIVVKSYLIEHGNAGFSKPPITTPNTISPWLQDNTMSAVFSAVDLTDFAPSRPLENSVNGGDISSIRIALFMEMNDKRLTNKMLFQAIAWTLTKYPNLFVTYEESAYAQAMELDAAKWDSRYYSLQEVYASMNFAEERVLHMLEVRKHVFNIQPNQNSKPSKPAATRPVSYQQQTVPQASTIAHTQTHQAKIRKDSTNNVLNTLLLVGGVVAALALVILAIIIE